MYPGEKKKPVVKRCARRAAFDVSSQSGASLLIIIMSMLVLGVLAAAMYAITSTSYFNQASSQGAMKAFYIAESGARIAASEVKAAANMNTTLVALDGKTFPLTGGSGQFTVNLYPYWFVVNSVYTCTTSCPTAITLKFPGSMPLLNKDSTTAVTIPSTGQLKIMDKGLAVYSSRTINVNIVTFTLSTPFNQSISVGTDAFLVAYPSSSQSIAKNGDIILNNSTGITAGTAQIFPPENGTFSVNLGPMYGIKHFTYKKRVPEVVPASPPSAITLQNIDDLTVNGYFSSFTPLAIGTTNEIYLGVNLGIQSTSVY